MTHSQCLLVLDYNIMKLHSYIATLTEISVCTPALDNSRDDFIDEVLGIGAFLGVDIFLGVDFFLGVDAFLGVVIFSVSMSGWMGASTSSVLSFGSYTYK